MAQDYYTILTNAGLAYEAQQKAQNKPITLKTIAIGDGNGAAYNPDPTATALRREVHRQPINSLLQDAGNPAWLVCEAWLEDGVGGWTIREVGIYTDTGILYAIAKYPDSVKPLLASGSGKQFYVKAIFQTSNAASVTLLVDNSVMMATRAFVLDYVRDELAKRDEKLSVRVATTANIALIGLQSIDGVTLVAGDRVLVKDQSAPKDNGIYVAASGTWSRAADADNAAKLNAGAVIPVTEGTVNADTLWTLRTDGVINIGTTALAFQWLGGLNAPTQATTDNSTKVATTAYVKAAIAALVNGSPAALDTLQELAEALGNDANFSTTMTNLLAAKAPLASPALTGTPTAPTQAATDNSTRLATTAYVKAAIAALVNGSPAALDTLQELAAALGNDANFSTTMTNLLAAKAPLASPALTGTPTAPTQAATDNSTRLATTAYVKAAIAALVNGSPAALDTLQELADALGNDANFSVTMTNLLAAKAPLASPALTGTPTAPTAAAGASSTQLATTAFVQSAVNSIVSISIAGAATTALSVAQSGGGVIVLTGAVTAAKAVTVPATASKWTVKHGGTGAFGVTFKTPAGTGVVLWPGDCLDVFCDGVNIIGAQSLPRAYAISDLPKVDVGPIFVTEAQELWTWQTAASNAVAGVSTAMAFAGYRSHSCGAPIFGHTKSPRAFELDAVGGWVSKTAYAGLWAYAVGNGLVAAFANWAAGMYKFVDGDIYTPGGAQAGKFLLPDLRNQFLRFTGTDADTANARALGSRQLDALQNITGSASISASVGILSTSGPLAPTGAFKVGPPRASIVTQNPAISSNALDFDASLSARTSVETRGVNTAFAPRIHA